MTAPALDLWFPADHGLCDLISAELQDLSPTAVHEIDPDGPFTWRVFFASVQARDHAFRALVRRFGADGLTAAAADVPDEDWAARSQADLRHVRIDRIVVAPTGDGEPMKLELVGNVAALLEEQPPNGGAIVAVAGPRNQQKDRVV